MDPSQMIITFFVSEWKMLLGAIGGLATGLGINKLPSWWVKQKILRRRNRKQDREEWITTTRDLLHQIERVALDYQVPHDQDYMLDLKRDFGSLHDSLRRQLLDRPDNIEDEQVDELNHILDQVYFLSGEPTDGVTEFGDNECFGRTAEACRELARDLELQNK